MIYICETTSAEAIIEEFAPQIDADIKLKLADAFEKRAEHQIDNAEVLKFNERIKKAIVGEVKSYFIPKAVKDDIQMIADVLPAKDKAKLMRLSYEDICQLKKGFESGIYAELIDALNKKLGRHLL